ncbi:hypothetical protein AAA151_20115, partial [[Clostridium] innocuum]
ERLVKVFMDKYEEMQKDDELWSTAMAIQMGEARYRYGLEDSFEEGKAEGEKQGIIKGRGEGECFLLNRQLEIKFHENCLPWLCSLSAEQIKQISSLILTCHTLEELKNQMKVSSNT